MEPRMQQAMERRSQGYNCCQAVACTYGDLVQVPETLLFRIAEGFGAGMGGMQSVCGALSGAVMLAGLSCSQGPQMQTKAQTYRLSHALYSRFQQETGAVLCKEIKGLETGTMLCSCTRCIEVACGLVEELVFPAAAEDCTE